MPKPPDGNLLEGKIQHHGRFGFVLAEAEGQEDLMIRGPSLRLAMDGDRVETSNLNRQVLYAHLLPGERPAGPSHLCPRIPRPARMIWYPAVMRQCLYGGSILIASPVSDPP